MGKRIFLSILILIILFSFASAHPGRTDGNGGHYDRSTGEYHYHHGHPEHQHPNGTCPYKSSGDNAKSDTIPNTAESRMRYQIDRIDEEQQENSQFFKSWNSGYDSGYDAGHRDGYISGKADGYNNGLLQGEEDGRVSAVAVYAPKIQDLNCALILSISAAALFAALYFERARSLNRLKHENKSLSNQLEATRSQLHQVSQRPKPRTLPKKFKLRQRKSSPPKVTAPPTISLLPNLPKELPRRRLQTFGHWPPNVHDADKQFKKYQRAETEQIELIEKRGRSSTIKGASGEIYFTTLDTCTCPDFNKNEHGKAPCKHIYFLAIHDGLPVDEIFEDFMKP